MKKKFLKFRLANFKIFSILFLLFVLSAQNRAQSSNFRIIEYQNQSLRELAEEFLGNPDYWETILKFNNLGSSSELEEGMRLRIPTGLVSSTLQKMDEAKSKISDANNNGAKVLTPKLITEAEINFNEVLTLKQQGNWEAAYDTLQDVLELATESFRQVMLLRESSADAAISFTKGSVEKRKPVEKLWSDAELYSRLYEADRARTLSNSIAEITFIDLSRIRLNENSQALIQHTRIDVFKNKTDTKVKLIKGDAFVYLLNSPKKKFDLDIPGLDIKIKSKNFWVEKEPVATKIANYEGEIELSAKNMTVVVKENQGSVIPDGGAPTAPRDLLPPPGLVAPDNMDKYFEDYLEFNWEKVSGAKQYWFELAKDASFQHIVYSNMKIRNTSIEVSDLSSGVYRWHVCSIDDLGFPGEFSRQNYLMINKDVTNPFLVISSPKNKEATRTKSISVEGESEPGLKLTINEQLIDLDENGKFTSKVELSEGQNRIVISSLDESGNVTNIERTVFYESSDQIENSITNENFFDEKNTFIINNFEFQLTGKTRSLSYIKFYYNEKEVSTYADTNGNYSIKLNILNRDTDLTQAIITPAGYSKTTNYKIVLDSQNPILKIDNAIPKYTKDESLKIEGSLFEGDSLFINSEIISVINNNFEKTLNLVDGENMFEIIATDIAGNSVSESISITKDSSPPKLLDYKLIRDSRNKSKYFLKVSAQDITGLIKSSVVTISVDGVDREVILKLTSNGIYSKNIFINEKHSKVVLKYIYLEDYLGNSKKIDIKL